MNASEYIAFYLKKYRDGDATNAFHGLLESPFDLIPGLIEAYDSSEYRDCRAFLVKVIWEHRQKAAIPFLSSALNNSEVWQEALNGLVCFSTPEALSVLIAARGRAFKKDKDKKCFSEWLEDAIAQTQEHLKTEQGAAANP